MAYKLGLQPPKPGAVRLRLATYLDFRMLPTPPQEFGHYSKINEWGMLANDQYGDCALAGACHQTMLYTAEGGTPAPFNDKAALANYSAVTGFNADDPSSDQGTQVGALADYWLRQGIVDAAGKRHQVVAIADMNPGDLRELWIATYLFQAVGLGFALPESAMDQTRDGKVWDVVPGADIVGGHYVPCFGRSNGNGIGVTWGALQPFTPDFYRTYNNQGLCVLSEEMMVNAKSIDGIDDQLLRADIAAMQAG